MLPESHLCYEPVGDAAVPRQPLDDVVVVPRYSLGGAVSSHPPVDDVVPRHLLDEIVPRYLLDSDHDWLAPLIDVAARHVGASRRILAGALAEPLPVPAPRDKHRLAAHVIADLCAGEVRAGVPPRLARREVFRERAQSAGSRDEVLELVAARLSVLPAQLEEALLADIRAERVVSDMAERLRPGPFALLANLFLAQGLVGRASFLTIHLEGHARRVVQQASWQGLLSTVHGDDPARCRIDISGPFAVLGPSRVYSRGLASLIPVLTWCRRFRLDARRILDGTERIVRITDTDPIERGAEPSRHDSRLERDFESDIRTLEPTWDILREPRPLRAAGTLIFPDFAIGPGSDPSSRVLVEIVGYWSRDYVEAKLNRLRACGGVPLITCVDAAAGWSRARGAVAGPGGDAGPGPGLGLGPDGDPNRGPDLSGLDVIVFRRRLDAARVLARARELLGSATGAG